MIGRMKRFNSIGPAEEAALTTFAAEIEFDGFPLSGYLAGRERGGYHVVALESAWARTFHVKHAIACNSATSGLLAASFAVGLEPGDRFVCPAMTMSATAAAPMFTGATPCFIDVSDLHFGIDCFDLPYDTPVFATNLFGHPADLTRLRRWCDLNRTYLIEDNAQSPFATEQAKAAGTIGHIGVWSLNVHKPIQCGEGGMITTDDDELAAKLRRFINHGENVDCDLGLNLRMPEACATIALSQLRRGQDIVIGRIAQAEAIIKAVGDIPGIRPPVVRPGCTHSYYTIPFLLDLRAGTADSDVNAIPLYATRGEFCAALREEGVPIVEGYVEPLYRKRAFAKFARECPVAEGLHDRRLFYFENCAWDPIPEQIEAIGAAFRRAAELVL